MAKKKPILNISRRLRKDVAPNYFGASHQQESDWEYHYIIEMTSSNRLVSERAYPSPGKASAAGRRTLTVHFS